MVYHGVPNWPPVWVYIKDNITKKFKGEGGVLKHVKPVEPEPERSRLVLAIAHEGKIYTGCLMFDDHAFCSQIKTLLQNYCGHSIQDIGDLDIPYRLTPLVSANCTN
jgi:hypothetical protein